jgi:hypothetical protein
MYTLNQALAEDRLRESLRRAELGRVRSRQSAERRWQRLERLVNSVHGRRREAARDASSVLLSLAR